MRALVVDDSSVMRRVNKGALRQAGIENVDDAVDGREAVEALRSAHYDLILMDWNMPNMDGLEAVRAGVNGFITKPFTPDTPIRPQLPQEMRRKPLKRGKIR